MTKLKQTMDNQQMGTCKLSLKTGISYSLISSYKGGYARPRYETAEKIAAALGVDIPALWDEPLNGQPEGE